MVFPLTVYDASHITLVATGGQRCPADALMLSGVRSVTDQVSLKLQAIRRLTNRTCSSVFLDMLTFPP